jgi:hypothetical protein
VSLPWSSRKSKCHIAAKKGHAQGAQDQSLVTFGIH